MAQSYPAGDRTQSQIEADLGATRDRLADSLTGLVDEVHPKRIKARTIGRIREILQARVQDARAYVFNARGDLRTDRVLTLSGVTAGVLTALLLISSLRRRRKRR